MGFFKKRDKPQEPAEATAEQAIGPAQREQLEARVAALQSELANASPDRQPELLNQLGQARTDLGDTDGAIEFYQQSLAVKEQFGEAYNALLNLYNIKLKQGAHAKDNAAIQLWSGKLDELMAMSKRVMRSNY